MVRATFGGGMTERHPRTIKIPLHPPLLKGEELLPFVCKGRWGGISLVYFLGNESIFVDTNIILHSDPFTVYFGITQGRRSSVVERLIRNQ